VIDVMTAWEMVFGWSWVTLPLIQALLAPNPGIENERPEPTENRHGTKVTSK
jgi:hypothetical protein